MAADYDITIEAGATFALDLTLYTDTTEINPLDLSSYSARMQIRRTVASSETLLDLTSSGGDITLGGEKGTVSARVSAAATGALTGRFAVYDLELEDASGNVTRWLQGSVKITPQVTR